MQCHPRGSRSFLVAALLASLGGCSEAPGVTTPGTREPLNQRPLNQGAGDAEPLNQGAGDAEFGPDEPTELWFVELADAPLLAGGEATALDFARDQLTRSAAERGLRYRLRFSFDRLWNGLSVRVAAGDAATLAALPGVTAVIPVAPIELDDAPTDSTPDVVSACKLSGADIVHSQLGYTGENVRVGVIDTGIDYHHPDLGGCFGPGCRVALGHDFVGDDWSGRDHGARPVPDDDPDDCLGHGTHVAGIIGANGVVRGVAPGVTLGAYRVFGCSGSTTADVMIEAMERAEADGMHVVNLSIGSPFQWPSYPTAVAASRLVERGVVVVASIGNSGDKGLWAAGAPGVGEHVIGVASIDNTHRTQPSFKLSADGAVIAYDRATGAVTAPLSGSAPLVRTGTAASVADGCDPGAIAAGGLAGAVALIRRGGCSFNLKSANAQAAGALGVVLYNNQVGTMQASVATGAPISVPVVTISEADGQRIDRCLDAGRVTLTWTDRTILTSVGTGALVSDFSSYGLSAALTFKPDISAPGGSIYSTYPLEKGGYESKGGTSMAAPHVAGAVALLLSARPTVSANAVRDLLQTTAVPAPIGSGSLSGVPNGTYRQGAGVLRVDRAIRTRVRIQPGRLALGESEAGPFSATLTLTNEGDRAIIYDISHVAAATASSSDHWTPTQIATGGVGSATVALDPRNVSIRPGGQAIVSVTITANPGLHEGSLYGGYLVFVPRGGTVEGALRVAYAGLKGDYQSLSVLTPADRGYPWLARRSGTTWVSEPTGGTFTLQGNDRPYVVAHLDHNAERLTLDVFEADTMQSRGRAFELAYVGQAADVGEVTGWSWDGKVDLNGTTELLPNGRYKLKLGALKALGDPTNLAHWETWTSPVVTIKHP